MVNTLRHHSAPIVQMELAYLILRLAKKSFAVFLPSRIITSFLCAPALFLICRARLLLFFFVLISMELAILLSCELSTSEVIAEVK